MGLSGYAQAGKPQAVLEDAATAIEVATPIKFPHCPGSKNHLVFCYSGHWRADY